MTIGDPDLPPDHGHGEPPPPGSWSRGALATARQPRRPDDVKQIGRVERVQFPDRESKILGR